MDARRLSLLVALSLGLALASATSPAVAAGLEVEIPGEAVEAEPGAGSGDANNAGDPGGEATSPDPVEQPDGTDTGSSAPPPKKPSTARPTPPSSADEPDTRTDGADMPMNGDSNSTDADPPESTAGGTVTERPSTDQSASTPTPSPEPAQRLTTPPTDQPVPEQDAPSLSGLRASGEGEAPRPDTLALAALFGSLGTALAVAVAAWMYRRYFQHRLP